MTEETWGRKEKSVACLRTRWRSLFSTRGRANGTLCVACFELGVREVPYYVYIDQLG
ncbi:hypothetical protein [Nostoc sp.]|uniref:hypothetical protein n=1 Tax=Nostoc sp. TaxID=1180 RepID=UPI002FFCD9BD